MKVLVAAITLLISVSSFAQESVDAILDTYVENIGGKEAFRALKGQKMTAEVAAQGMSIPVEVYVMADGKMITLLELMGMSIAQDAYDGTDAWETNFMTQKAERKTAETAENMKRAIGEYPTPLLDYAEKGFKAELMESAIVEGVDCFKIKLTKKPILVDGKDVENVEYYYFDKESFIPVQVEAEMHSGPMKGEIGLTLYSDYQEVDGLYFPFSMVMKTADSEGQAIEFDTIELNPTVEEGFFTFPGE